MPVGRVAGRTTGLVVVVGADSDERLEARTATMHPSKIRVKLIRYVACLDGATLKSLRRLTPAHAHRQRDEEGPNRRNPLGFETVFENALHRASVPQGSSGLQHVKGLQASE
jgi:hypothetical protein